MARLRIQNPKLNTTDWSVMSRKVTEKDQKLAFSIDPNSFKALTGSNFKAFWGLKRVIFRTLKDEQRKPEDESTASHLHHSRAASAALGFAMKDRDVALIQEPFTYKGKIKLLKEVDEELINSVSIPYPRTRILVKKGFQILPLMHYCSKELTAVKIKTSVGGVPREIILESAYLQYDDVEPPPPGELERLVTGCRADGTNLIVGCDANSHHTSAVMRTRITPPGEVKTVPV